MPARRPARRRCGADRYGDQDQEVREQGDGRRDWKDPTVGARGTSPTSAPNLTRPDQMRQPWKPPEYMGPRAALHMGHDCAGMPDDQGEDQEETKDGDEAEGDREGVAHGVSLLPGLGGSPVYGEVRGAGSAVGPEGIGLESGFEPWPGGRRSAFVSGFFSA